MFFLIVLHELKGEHSAFDSLCLTFHVRLSFSFRLHRGRVSLLNWLHVKVIEYISESTGCAPSSKKKYHDEKNLFHYRKKCVTLSGASLIFFVTHSDTDKQMNKKVSTVLS